MKKSESWFASLLAVLFAASLLTLSPSLLAQDAAPAPSVIVTSKFGGQIFGFDIDPNGTEGVLSEAQTVAGGKILAAVETFDQNTGKILKVIARANTMDDFLTLGIVGNSVGLVEREHTISFLNIKRTFGIMNPVSGNKFTGLWTPPIDKDHLIEAISRNTGTKIAVWAYDNSSNFQPNVFSSDVAANTFGPVVKITDQDFTSGATPGFGLNTVTNQAILGHAKLGNPFIPGVIGLVNLTTGGFTQFTGVGVGDVNGLAVDSADGVACTTTEIDFSVQFYDLASHSGFSQPLPGATNQFFSGADVEYDSVNKLFLVAQPNSSTSASGSSVHVYDVHGNLVKSINGLNFSNAFNVVPAHIALNPSKRIAFVDGPDAGVTQIQSFAY